MSRTPDIESPPDSVSQSTSSDPLTQSEQALVDLRQHAANLEQTMTDLRQRAADLQQQIQTMEREVNQAHAADLKTRMRRLRLRGMFFAQRCKPRSMLYFGSILFLGLLPSAYVFLDRWLFMGRLSSPLDAWWCKSKFLCESGMPQYFSTILVCIVAVLLLVLLGRDDFFQVMDTHFLRAASGSTPHEVSKRRLFVSRLAFISAGFILTGAFLYSLVKEQIFSPGFLAALGCYWAGWLIREFPAQPAAVFLARHWRSLLALGLVHITLILLLRAIENHDSAVWLFALILSVGLIYLAPHLRFLPAKTFWLVNLALLLFIPGLNNWAYSIVGDEGAFFRSAEYVLVGMSRPDFYSNLFNGLWVYGQHPFFSTVLQSASMKLFGAENFGWRFSSLYLSVLAVGLFYLFFSRFLRQRQALLVALCLAFSSYLIAFSKIGYNNLQSLFTMALALACSAWALTSRRTVVYALTGLCLGLCFYVYPAGLYVVPLPLFLLALYDPPLKRQSLQRWAWLFVSFAILLAPLIMQPNYWLSKLQGLVSNNPDLMQTPGAAWRHTARNLLYAFLSPLYIMEESHFVVIGYMDVFSALLHWIGLATVLKRVKRERFMLFSLLSYLFLLVVVGASHDRNFPPATRMFILLPFFSLFAALGLEWVVEKARNIWAFQAAHTTKAFYGLMGLVLCLNLLQAYPLSWRRSFPQDLEKMFLRMIQETKDFAPQSDNPRTFLFITDSRWGIDGLLLMSSIYSFPASQVHLERLVIDGPALPEAAYGKITERNTLVIFQVSLDPGWRAAIEQKLTSMGKRSCPIRDYSNQKVQFTLWHSPEMRVYCISGP